MKKFIKTSELCDMFNITRQTVATLIKEKKIPYYQIGGGYRFDVEECVEFFRVPSDDTNTEIKE